MNNKNITIVSSEKLWMEGDAIIQTNNLANLNGVVKVVGMPDLHAGKTPIGVTVITKDRIYPYLIGNDIGCGMSIYDINIEVKRIKMNRWVSTLNTIKTLSCVPNTSYQEDCPIHDFGTIGAGNHFAEFQLISEITNPLAAEKLGLKKGALYLNVHSGSRSYGSKILSEYPSYEGYSLNSEEAKSYIIKHNNALMWASKNRDEVAAKLINYLGYEQQQNKLSECDHNFLEIDGEYAFHRKGSVSSKNPAVIIAGSRGTLSYIVEPTEKCADYAYSLAHGAGRKWARSMCRSRIRMKYTPVTIKENKYNGKLVCHDMNLVYEEVPDAYKNIEHVIRALIEHGLINVIASLKPILTFKG